MVTLASPLAQVSTQGITFPQLGPVVENVIRMTGMHETYKVSVRMDTGSVELIQFQFGDASMGRQGLRTVIFTEQTNNIDGPARVRYLVVQVINGRPAILGLFECTAQVAPVKDDLIAAVAAALQP